MLQLFKSKIIVLIFLLNSFCSADTNNLTNIKTFQSNFTQTITNPSGNKAVYKGTLHIKEPYYIKWKYESPIEKFVYIKKYTVTIIEPELEQAIMTRLNKEINILTLLQNAKQTSPSNYISNFNNIEYKLSFQQKNLHTISYNDELENKVNISFSKVKQNKPIEDAIFKFHIPSEYDMIRK